jgi:hypothetical protein
MLGVIKEHDPGNDVGGNTRQLQGTRGACGNALDVVARVRAPRRPHADARLRADVKPSLRPAVQRWTAQYGSIRPLEAKLSEPRTLHDRAIFVDGKGAWVLTQSFNAFAARAPGMIVRVDSETATLKIAAYEALWQSASSLIP